jgi:monodechloroaminopyrrolnitrin synthase
MYFPEYSKTSIDQWLVLNDTIVSLDPLKFDDRISLLHKLNREADTTAIIQLLYDMLPLPDALDQYSYEESIATMRDLGIFVGILKKHGIEPVEVVPELEFVLLVLMVKTALPPRDTLIHYTLCNPVGSRMRTYTGLPDERSLIESVKMAMPDLWKAIVQLEELHCADLSGPEFVSTCFSLRDKMNAMVKGVVHAKRNVNPAVFANELRFYYDPIKVDYNKDYIGPGAVEMPMFVFDHLLWSSDCDDHTYTAFKEGYLSYNLSFVREIYWNFKGRKSLVTRVLENLDNDPTPENYLAANAVLELSTVLKSFRMPHKKLAEDAYAHDKEHNRQHGSGGYSTDILSHIIHLQSEKIEDLKTSIAYAKVKTER